MKTPALRSEAETDRIVLVPDVDEPRSRGPFVLLALALVLAMVLGGGVVYAWQQREIRDGDGLVQEARVNAAAAQNRADAALARVGSLQGQLTQLQSLVEDQADNVNILEGQSAEARRRVEAAQARLAEARDDLEAVTGPRVSNGRHIGYILSAGTAQSPPMIVIDLGRWFSGPAAAQVAIADSALTAGEHLFRGRYLRNSEHDWRILPVASGTLFTVLHYNGASIPANVSFTTLDSILRSSTRTGQRIAHDPFWIDVQGHMVTGGHEQRYRAP